MSRRAWLYIYSVITAGAVLCGLNLIGFLLPTSQLVAFVVLTILATGAQLFKVEANKQTYYATLIFVFAGVLLLHPFLFALLVIISYLIEWIKERAVDSRLLRDWYLQPFNMATHIIAGLAAQWVFGFLSNSPTLWFVPSIFYAVLAAALVYVVTNHILIGFALVLARRIPLLESGILDFENLANEMILLLMGAVMSALWTLSPWLIPLALSPLVLMYRALQVPQLKIDASTDPKTGLWNVRHLMQSFASELDRAKRFDRPLSFIMADLDLLRNINNTYGHLAGDAVLAGIARVIRETLRDYDIAGRFGGEEFAIVLPETTFASAQIIAERLRSAVEATVFKVETAALDINATLSLGVASFPEHANLPNDLIHAADLAVYQAKLKGRNCIVGASDVPRSTQLEPMMPEGRVYESYPKVGIPRSHPESVAAPSARAYETEATENKTPAQQTSGTTQRPTSGATPNSKLSLALFIAWVITAGVSLALFTWHADVQLDPLTLIILVTLAVVAEILHINLYGEGTMSVSLTMNFAAALIAGMPGVILVSAAIAISDRIALALNHRFTFRQALYKAPFNWATHVLAGLAPTIGITLLSSGLHEVNLLTLGAVGLIAALAYYLIDTGLIAVVISLDTGARLFDTWREKFQWLGLHYIVLCVIGIFLYFGYAALGWLGIIAFALPISMMRYVQKQYIDRTKDSMQELKRMNAELMRANREVTGASKAIHQLNDELFFTLSKIIDTRDPYVLGHASKVADYALAIARQLDFSEERLKNLQQAAFLHDIGKIGIPEQLLHKPDGLTVAEYELVKTHAALGADLLATSQSLRHLAPFVRHHHEWWNGKGYPNELSGEQIPLEARILSVCDAVEAMASDRSYHRALSWPEVAKELKRYEGIQFDPEVVKVFLDATESATEPLVTNSANEVMRMHAQRPAGELALDNHWITSISAV